MTVVDDGSSQAEQPSETSRSRRAWIFSWEQLESLPPRQMGILQQIEIPISLLGYSERQVAARLGTRLGVVRQARAELRKTLGADE